jgi:hypothetical protein
VGTFGDTRYNRLELDLREAQATIRKQEEEILTLTMRLEAHERMVLAELTATANG